MNKAQDERCVACLRSMDAAMKRAFTLRVWAEVNKGRTLLEVLRQISPGTQFEEAAR